MKTKDAAEPAKTPRKSPAVKPAAEPKAKAAEPKPKAAAPAAEPKAKAAAPAAKAKAKAAPAAVAVAEPEPADEPAAEKAPTAKSRNTKRRSAPPRARAGGPPIALVGLLVAMGAGGGVGGALFFANSKPSNDSAIAPVTSAPTIAAAPAPAPAPAPIATPPKADSAATAAAIAAAQRLLLSGHERDALELLATCPPSPEVEKARTGILDRCREVLVEEGVRLRRLARQGKDPAPHMANLRQRLPDSLRGEVDKLALALREALAPVPAAETEDEAVAPTPTELSEPAEEEAEEEKPAEEPAVAARPAPRTPERPAPKPPAPAPAPAPAGPSRPTADEPPPADDEPFTPPDGPSAEEEGDAVMIAALREMLHVQHRLRAGVVDMTYPFDSDAERQDFEMRGFDKAEINTVHGVGSGHTGGANDLELGAGSRGTGRLQHVLDLAGDFEVEMRMWVGSSSGRSNFMMIMGKIGVRWGEQLVKIGRGGAMKPLGAEPDRMAFSAERDVTVKMIRRGDELKILLNGRQVACKTFEKEDLDGKFSIVMSDLRLIVTSLRVSGKVDGSKL